MHQVCRATQPAVAGSPVVDRFDAELYLRLLGEEILLGARERRDDRWSTPLVEPASALVAVGGMSAGRAEAVIGDFALAAPRRTKDGLKSRPSSGTPPRRRKRKIKPLEPR